MLDCFSRLVQEDLRMVWLFITQDIEFTIWLRARYGGRLPSGAKAPVKNLMALNGFRHPADLFGAVASATEERAHPRRNVGRYTPPRAHDGSEPPLEHFVTHDPADPRCPTCRDAKARREPARATRTPKDIGRKPLFSFSFLAFLLYGLFTGAAQRIELARANTETVHPESQSQS